MRRALALLLAVPIVGLAPLLASPAAGETYYHVVRALDDRFDVAGFTCTGEPAAAPTARIGVSDVHLGGQGSMLVRSAPDSVGAPMLVDPRKPGKVAWNVWPTEGADPQARWRVEMNGDVLTSDPIALTPRSWNNLYLPDATLHAGDWSGTIADYIAQFHKGQHWRVGLLTGDCLGSPEVRLDEIGTRQFTYDFEARSWVMLKVLNKDGTQWGTVRYGEPFRVIARANRWDPKAGHGHPVADAHLAFQRRWAGTHRWRTVARERTGDTGRVVLPSVSERAAYWRAVWHRSPQPVPSDMAYQGSDLVYSVPLVNGTPCTPRSEEEQPWSCARMTVPAGRVVLSGHASPGGAGRIHLYVYAGTSRELVSEDEVPIGDNGHWRVAFPTAGHDALTVALYGRQTTKQHWAGPVGQIPITVR